jgi:hypothetical protein
MSLSSSVFEPSVPAQIMLHRILVIFGAGHIPILRHCVLASPEYNLVEVREYLALTTDH